MIDEISKHSGIFCISGEQAACRAKEGFDLVGSISCRVDGVQLTIQLR